MSLTRSNLVSHAFAIAAKIGDVRAAAGRAAIALIAAPAVAAASFAAAAAAG